jgi:hypothetical protein
VEERDEIKMNKNFNNEAEKYDTFFLLGRIYQHYIQQAIHNNKQRFVYGVSEKLNCNLYILMDRLEQIIFNYNISYEKLPYGVKIIFTKKEN